MIKGFSAYINEQYKNPKETFDLKYGNPQKYQLDKMNQGSDLYSEADGTELWKKWESTLPPLQTSEEVVKSIEELIMLGNSQTEEDVEFADRTAFHNLVTQISSVLKRLIDSFAVGNVIKNGIPVAIVGEPNVGKSTLLNALLNEERAIVSDIAGTTRDTIEDELVIGGIGFRFIDTAGIRETKDVVESIGIQKTFEKIYVNTIIAWHLPR